MKGEELVKRRLWIDSLEGFLTTIGTWWVSLILRTRLREEGVSSTGVGTAAPPAKEAMIAIRLHSTAASPCKIVLRLSLHHLIILLISGSFAFGRGRLLLGRLLFLFHLFVKSA